MQKARVVSEEVDDGWIWGSSRGGGGAPLKSKDGTPVTNLKLVINGDVDVAHAPTGSPSRRSNHGSGSKTSRRGGYDDDYDYDHKDRRDAGRRGGRDPYDDDDYGACMFYN